MSDSTVKGELDESAKVRVRSVEKKDGSRKRVIDHPHVVQPDENLGDNKFIFSLARHAEKYIGQTERPPNRGFSDPAFESKMKEVGWVVGHPWCMYALRLVLADALVEHGLPRLAAVRASKFYINPSALTTWELFQKHASEKLHERTFRGTDVPMFNVVTSETLPSGPSFVIYETDRAAWRGHGEIALSRLANDATIIRTAGGNVRDKNSGNEGFFYRNRSDESFPNFKLLGYAQLF